MPADPVVYVARQLTDVAMHRLRAGAWNLREGNEEPPSAEDLAAGLAGASAAIVTLTERIDDALLATAPELRVVANVAVGYDNIDVPAAERRGVAVTNTPGVLDGATADHTMALILDVSRRITEADAFLRSGASWVWGPRFFAGLDLSAGAVLGIVGYGRIGQAVARRAAAFDMRIIAHSPSREPGTSADGVEFVRFEDVLARADVLTLHCPLVPSTRHLIDREALALMKPTAVLVNVARGGVVDEAALVDALDSGRIAGAALDVYEGEPSVDPRLLASDRTVLTPHTASAGLATRDAMGMLAIDNVERVLAGQEPVTPVASR